MFAIAGTPILQFGVKRQHLESQIAHACQRPECSASPARECGASGTKRQTTPTARTVHIIERDAFNAVKWAKSNSLFEVVWRQVINQMLVSPPEVKNGFQPVIRPMTVLHGFEGDAGKLVRVIVSSEFNLRWHRA